MRMRMRPFLMILGVLLSVLCPVPSDGFPFQSSGLAPIPESSSDNVECFLDYMELWVPKKMMNGLLLWLSRVMRFPVSLSSLDRSNHLLSRCRYALDMDNNANYIFRVHYSACNVQTQKGFHILEILMVKKTSSGNSQSNRYILKCPALTAALGREKVRCDPTYVQVTRPLPLGNSDVQDWYLTFRGELVVAVEDASLIGVEVEMNDVNVTVRGLRGQLLNPRQFLDRQTDVLPLWMAHGFYAYSMEASCPPVSQHPGEEVVVYIPKQRVGLVKRGSYITESLTLKNIVAGQAISISVTENKQFVMVNIPAHEVLRQQDCSTTGDPIQRVQAYYSIDLVLKFAEIAYPMNWTLENYYECIGLPSKTANITVNKTWVDQQSLSVATTPNPESKFPLPTNLTLFSVYTQEKQDRQNTVTSDSALASKTSSDNSEIPLLNGVSVKPTQISPEHFVEGTDIDTSGSGDYSESQLYENPKLESSDLGSGTQEHYPDSLLLNRYIKSKQLLELPRSLEISTGSFLSAQTTGKNMTISINNTNPGKASHLTSEIKHKDSSPVGEHEGLENIDFRPNTLTANLSNSSTTFNQNKVFSKNITDIKRSSLSQRPMSGAVSREILPRDTQTEVDEREKYGFFWLSPRGHQIKKGEEEIIVTSTKAHASGHEIAEHLMSIPTVKGPNRQPKDAQFLSETNTGQHQPLSDNLPKNPQYSVIWSTSSHHIEEILNKTTSEIEITVSDEQLLLAASG